MEVEPQIVFENMSPSAALRERIKSEIDHLEQFHGRMTACRVVVHAPEKHQHKGNLFNIHIHLVMPGKREIAVRPSAARHQWHEDPNVAIRDAFDAARRQLQDKVRRQRGDVKQLAEQARGKVLRVFPENDYGFIGSEDGQEIYFHRNSLVSGDFGKLKPGAKVRFVAVPGEKGMQASTVHLARARAPRRPA